MTVVDQGAVAAGVSGRGSLARRLAAALALGQLLLAVGLVWVGILFSWRQLSAALDATLRARVMSVLAAVRYPETGTGLIFDATLLPASERSTQPDFYQVRDAAGQVVASTFPAGLTLPAPATGPRAAGALRVTPGVDARSWAGYWQFTYGGARYRGLLLSSVPIMDREEDIPPPPARLTVVYATPLAGVEHRVEAAGAAIAGLSLLLLAGSLWLTIWMVGRALRPLRTLAEDAAAISPRQWHFQPAPATAAVAELRPLTLALTRMLERLRGSYEAQRDFLANAAHELKTPVAVMKSTVQSTLRRPRAEAEYRDALQATLFDIERIEYLLGRMLRLARAEQRVDDETSPPATAELAPSCEAAAARVAALAQGHGVSVQLRLEPQAGRVRGDADDLELAWVNLLENAIQHSPEGAPVELAAVRANGDVTVTVSDRGGGIAPGELPHIFERFHRGAAARARHPQGFGLGLAITHAIVQAAGGTIAVRSRPGETVFEVRLPAARNAAAGTAGA